MKQKLLIWSAVILLLAAVGFMIKDFFYNKTNNDNPYNYNLDKLKEIDPSRICYEERRNFQIDIEQPVSITIDINDNLFVAGRNLIEIFDTALNLKSSIHTGCDIVCLAVDGDSTIYLGVNDHIEKWSLKGNVVQVWDTINSKAYLTSIALSETSVFIADAGNKVVYRYDRKGKLINKIGEKNSKKGVPGFIIPSPYFDLLVGREGELVVVNPGRHSFEFYKETGDLITSWTRTSMGLDGFSGCCNPSNIAMLSDGSFVTSEKGLERVKVHLPTGDFKCVVAAPDLFQEGTKGIDLAVDSKDRIFVLDPVKKIIRMFSKKIE